MIVNALRLHRVAALAAALLIAVPHLGLAQGPAPSPAQQSKPEAKAPPVVTAGPEGFSIASPDGAFRLGIGGYIQLDARRYLDDSQNAGIDGFELRRIRPIFTGTLYRFLDFRMAIDFGEGKVQLMDAYVDFRIAKGATLRAGKFKPYYGLERLQSASELRFVERGLATNLAPNRDYGLALFGDVARNRVSYGVGLHNGTVDGSNVDLDDNDGKDVVGRLMVRPFGAGKNKDLQTLAIGVAATYGPRSGTASSPSLPAYKTPGQLAFFRYRANTIVGDGHLSRLSPQMNWAFGPIVVFAEHTISRQDVSRLTDGASATVEVVADSVTAGWTLTGERESLRNVAPAHPFNRATGDWGALELVLRADRQTIGDEAFPIYADPAVSASRARSWGLGLNWYLNRGLKISSSYQHTTFRQGAPAGGRRQAENTWFSRMQIVF